MNHISASITSLPDREDSCDKHGVFTSRNFLGRVWSKCPVCSQEEADRRKQEEEQEARRKRKEAWQTQIGEAGIPERFQTAPSTTTLLKPRSRTRRLRSPASTPKPLTKP